MVMPVVSVLKNGCCTWRDAANTQKSYCASWWQPVREKQYALWCRCNMQCAQVVIPGSGNGVSLGAMNGNCCAKTQSPETKQPPGRWLSLHRQERYKNCQLLHAFLFTEKEWSE